MKKFIIMPFSFNLFDGEGAEGTSESGTNQQPAHTLTADAGQSKKGGLKNVMYGKQPESNEPVAEADIKIDSDNSKNLRAKYDQFMSNEAMKKIYNEETQKVINRRFKETKNLQEQNAKKDEILSKLRQRYNVGDDDALAAAIDNDNALWEDAAAEQGMSVEQYRLFRDAAIREQKQKAVIEQYQRQEAARAQYNIWLEEAKAVKVKYPEFDLEKELQNPNFAGLIAQRNPQYQISMTQAYEICHLDDIKAQTAETTENKVVANIRAKGQRPREGAIFNSSAAIIKDDVSKLTRADRREIAERAARGEIISF